MDTFEMQLYVLARLLRTGNDATITSAVQKIKSLEPSSNVTELIDKANLPFLVDHFAPLNKAAVNLIRDHREVKARDMFMGKQSMLEKFRVGLMSIIGNTLPGRNIFDMLSMMIYMRDVEYSKTAVCLFRDLNFLLEEYMEVLPFLEDIRGEFPEVDELIRKIREMLGEFDIGVVLDDEEAGLQTNDSIVSDHEVYVPSGYDSDEEEALEHRRLVEFESAFVDLYMKLLADAIMFGTSETIKFAIEASQHYQFPLTAYRKFEITALIREYGFYCNEAVSLWRKIDSMEDLDLADYVFNHIAVYIDSNASIHSQMMEVLMGYLVESDRYMDQILRLFINKEVSLELFRKHQVEQFLYNQPELTVDMLVLVQKICNMEAF